MLGQHFWVERVCRDAINGEMEGGLPTVWWERSGSFPSEHVKGGWKKKGLRTMGNWKRQEPTYPSLLSSLNIGFCRTVFKKTITTKIYGRQKLWEKLNYEKKLQGFFGLRMTRNLLTCDICGEDFFRIKEAQNGQNSYLVDFFFVILFGKWSEIFQSWQCCTTWPLSVWHLIALVPKWNS